MPPSIRIGRPRPPRVHYGPLVIAAAVMVALLVFAKMATSRFQWWREAAFEGKVVGKQAVVAASGTPAQPGAALEAPSSHRFFLRVEQDGTIRAHEVIAKVFRDARVGDLVIKRRGSYEARITPAPSPAAAESHQSPRPHQGKPQSE